MSNLKTFLDEFNILHLNENPKFDQSENGLTFTGEYHAIAKYLDWSVQLPQVDLSNFMTIGDDSQPLFLPTPKSERNAHFSLDNMSGIYCLRELYHPNLELPTSKWYKPKNHDKNESAFWLRPDTLAFFGLLNHNPFWSLIAKPVILFASKLSFSKPKAVTSGKRMWFARFCLMAQSPHAHIRKIGEEGIKQSEQLLKKEHGENPMADVMSIYFKNPNHPIHELMLKYYGLS